MAFHELFQKQKKELHHLSATMWTDNQAVKGEGVPNVIMLVLVIVDGGDESGDSRYHLTLGSHQQWPKRKPEFQWTILTYTPPALTIILSTTCFYIKSFYIWKA